MEESSSTNIPAPAEAKSAPETPSNISVAGAAPAITPDRENDQLKITLGEFEGPLDLLLYLIRQEQVNIYDIPIARITDEYLRYLNLMQELDLTVAGDFLVMAAQLIEVKSRMLLPRDPLAAEEEIEDPRADLVNRLARARKIQVRSADALVARDRRTGCVYARGNRNRQKQS